MGIINRIALILSIIGGLNWGLIGLFKFDLVAWICGGQMQFLQELFTVLLVLQQFGASAFYSETTT